MERTRQAMSPSMALQICMKYRRNRFILVVLAPCLVPAFDCWRRPYTITVAYDLSTGRLSVFVYCGTSFRLQVLLPLMLCFWEARNVFRSGRVNGTKRAFPKTGLRRARCAGCLTMRMLRANSDKGVLCCILSFAPADVNRVPLGYLSGHR